MQWLRGVQETRTDYDGTFAFEDVVHLPKYALEVLHDDFAAHRGVVFPPADAVEVHLAPRCQLNGWVTRADGTPPPMAVVVVASAHGASLVRDGSGGWVGGLRTVTDAAGRFEIAEAPVGPVVVHVLSPPHLEAVVATDLVQGSNGVEIGLRSGRTIGVSVVNREGEAGSGAPLRLLGSSKNGRSVDRSAVADDRGQHVFHALTPGTYTLLSGQARELVLLREEDAGDPDVRLILVGRSP